MVRGSRGKRALDNLLLLCYVPTMDDLHPKGICVHCNRRSATRWWTGDGGSLGFIHGAKQAWCMACCLIEQIAHAKVAVEKLPKMEAELRALLGAEDLNTGILRVARDALMTARDCIAFDGSLGKVNDNIIANRALEKIDVALALIPEGRGAGTTARS